MTPREQAKRTLFQIMYTPELHYMADFAVRKFREDYPVDRDMIQRHSIQASMYTQSTKVHKFVQEWNARGGDGDY